MAYTEGRATLVREGETWLVRHEVLAEDRPELIVRYWPVSLDRTKLWGIALESLLGVALEDRGYTGNYHVCVENANWSRFRDVTIVVGARTEVARLECHPVAPPKVRPGIEIRWYRQRWQKLLKKGWVDV